MNHSFAVYVDSSVTKQNDVARSIKVHLNQPTHDSGEPIALKWLRMRKKRSTADSISSQADSYTNVNSQSLPAEPLPTPAESKKLVKAGWDDRNFIFFYLIINIQLFHDLPTWLVFIHIDTAKKFLAWRWACSSFW